MSKTLSLDELAEAKAHAEQRASEATEAAPRIFFRACATVLADALERATEEAV
ncbi:hypothetical protein [Pseudooceanicola sp. 200-1SW]|uniref:hypothetical protein n=1 Tax=Pseudooceanicola sp. 200-1SW TaxID=3425949 RepID=UPI003D7FDD51